MLYTNTAFGGMSVRLNIVMDEDLEELEAVDDALRITLGLL